MTIDQPLWWQSGIIYQIYPRSFQDSNADGVGDLPGISTRVDYLEQLGIDAVWLSPFYPSPMADFGYDVSNYTDVDPLFGTLQDFDDLTEALHQRGMKIMIDYIPNHSSDQHPWFQQALLGRDNPYRDWYVWADAGENGGPPNNWLSVFGGPAWEWEPRSRQYYLHSFLKEQPDLNWRNPRLKQAMLDVLRFWLDRGVDGFRIDAAHFIAKDPDFRDNPPNPAGRTDFKAKGAYDSQLHLHDVGRPEGHETFREIRSLLDSYPTPRCSIGEIHVSDWREWAGYYGTQLDELHFPYNFNLLAVPWTADAVGAVVDASEAALPAGAWPNFVLGNHDEHRIASRVGVSQARAAMMLLLTLRGTPTIYYGDEIGMTDVMIPPDRARDPWGLRVAGLDLGRDPQRTPMQWDACANAGFCPAAVEPWLPIGDDYTRVNAAVESAEPASMLSLTEQLIQLRRRRPSLSVGDYQPLEGAPADCYLYTRRHGQESSLIALNFSDEPRTVSVSNLHGDIALSTYLDRSGPAELSGLELRPNEGLIVEIT
ncbi:MAG: alpha-amylase family glycosyl hydrolase [Chloroflexota bacterium]